MTALYLVRHGETVFNEDGRYQGQLDSPLTERGIRQASVVAGLLADRVGDAPVRLVTSPLGRAYRTAQIIAEALPDHPTPEPDSRLSEVGMGDWDGLTRAEIADRWPDARRGRSTREWMFHGPGGESMEDLAARLSALLEDLDQPRDQTVILVSHAVSGRILRALHSSQPFLDALKLDAPQDAAFELQARGAIAMHETEDYRRRHGEL